MIQVQIKRKGDINMISAVLSVIIVNLLYRLYAKLIGADVIFYSGKKKLGAYVVLWAILFGTLGI